MALRIDSALFNAGRNDVISGANVVNHKGPVPMEIGNLEGPQFVRNEERQKDLDKIACFSCHVVGCRPWKHKGAKLKKAKVNNVGGHVQALPSEDNDFGDSNSEN